ncbi:cyclic nucleotide-binding/CBS domain-containing protein [Luteimonas sp. SJ-92]|uniref:Cyclic nucleotide-binding/CBS domain-containing protein n=1 Tax=Luteimonas salinisoli TaxID=2752307 RepID=A0A853JC34_9GAMM|nr:putative nucleotidyltransferase substrate binding domain-containing protein [Luteimonas salinisoli]NZA26806.1 cyclic nucleotide-binding/CBS domain-containing protein [Luteimonas salinisoli]
MDSVPGLDLSQPPFDLLDDAGRARLQASVDLGFHAAGTTLIEAGKASPHVHVILKGLVHAYQADGRGGEQRFADYGPGDVFGAWAAMAGRARLSYRADGECLSFLIPAEVFRRLIQDNPRFAAYFNEGLATKGQLSVSGADRREAAELMVTRVGEAQLAPAEHVTAATSIADATARLRERRVDCLLVDDADHPEPGILTRTDLLDAVALQRLPLEAPVGPLASRPLVCVGSDDVLFQALIGMTEHRVERVVVRDRGTIAGTLGIAEVLSHFAAHSHLISLRLARAHTLEDIASAAAGMTELVRSLAAHGARMPYLMGLVSALNGRVMAQIFDLLVPSEHRDRICLLVMGSEGRREQLLKTDQDNALVVADDLDWPGLAEAMDRFSTSLSQVGYPPCPGRVMVDNPHWRMTAAQWQARIGHWQQRHGGEAALDLSIALDARPIAGNAALFAPVKAGLATLGQDEILLHHLASATLNFNTPLTFFGRVRGDPRGIDLKKGAIFPIVHGVRCLALRHGIAATGSIERCEALTALAALPRELGRDLPQALNVFQRMRLEAQLAALEAGRVPDNHVDTQALRRLDRELLRDALHVVKEFREHVRRAFHLVD